MVEQEWKVKCNSCGARRKGYGHTEVAVREDLQRDHWRAVVEDGEVRDYCPYCSEVQGLITNADRSKPGTGRAPHSEKGGRW